MVINKIEDWYINQQTEFKWKYLYIKSFDNRTFYVEEIW